MHTQQFTPAITEAARPGRFKPRGGHKAMMLCCAAMLLPVGLFLAGGGGLASLGANFIPFAPLALCLGMHVVMHRAMGKPCLSSHDKPETADTGASMIGAAQLKA